MAKVYVGSARSDENNAAHGGQAGDQKGGREVSMQARSAPGQKTNA